MKNKNLLISSCIFVLLFAVTFGILFLTYSVDDLLLCLKMIKSTFYLIIGIAIVIFFTLEAIYFKIIFKSLDENISFRRCMHYSFVEFFFSGITPGSTGGQPVQLYYMNKDKIPMKKSMIALILNTILFKLFFVVTGILIIIFKFNYISMSKTVVKVLFFIGLTYDIVAIIICLLLMYNQKLISKILTFFYKIYNKITNKNIDYKTKIKDITESYVEEANYIKNNVGCLILSTILVFLQRTIMFSIIYIIYISINSNPVLNYFDIVMLQIFVQQSLEVTLLPGQAGVGEYITGLLYTKIFDHFQVQGMMLNRLFMFYLPLLISFASVMIGIRTLYNKPNINETEK